MNDVFISYSRRDKVFTQKLYEALKAVNRIVWADWDSIPAASDWDAEIKQGIEQTDSVLFVLSPEWLKSNECRKELVHAVAMGKRLFPILYINVDPAEVPPELAKINWVYMRDTDDFDKGFQTLCSAMDTDLEWIKTHTRIQVRAIEWDKKKRDNSFALHGKDLADGEQFIAGAAHKSPEPTPLQGEYVLASRKDAIRRQRLTLIGVTIALIVSIALGVTAFFQRQAAVASATEAANQAMTAVAAESTAVSAKATAVANEQEAIRQKNIALARLLAGQANPLFITGSSDQMLPVLLAAQSMKLFPNVEATHILQNPILGQRIASLSSQDIVNSIAFSPNSKYLVSGSDDKTARVWEIATGKEIARMTYGGFVTSVAFSPDGKYVVSGGCDEGDAVYGCTKGKGSAYVLDVATGKEVAHITHDDKVTSVAFSPNSKYIATGSWDNTVRIWEASTGKEVTRMTHDYFVSSVAFSSDGKYIVSGSWDLTARVWETTTGKEVARVIHDWHVVSVAFSPDGKYVASATESGAPRIWDITTGKDVARLNQDSDSSDAIIVNRPIAFSLDGKYLLSNGCDEHSIASSNWCVKSSVYVWETATGNKVARMPHAGNVTSTAFSPDSKYVVSGSDDKTARVWETATGKEVALMMNGDLVTSVAFSPDGAFVVVGGCDKNGSIDNFDCVLGSAQVWKIPRTITTVATMDSFAYSPDGKYEISGYGCDQYDANNNCTKGSIQIRDTTTNTEVAHLIHGYNVTKATFSPDSKLVVSIGCDEIDADLRCIKNSVQVWGVSTGKELTSMTRDVQVNSVAFSPSSKYVVSGSCDEIDALRLCSTGDGNIRMWEALTGKEIVHITTGGGVFFVAFSPDGKYVASAECATTDEFFNCKKSVARIWDVSTGNETVRIPYDGGYTVSAVSFSSNGKYFISAGGSGVDLPQAWIWRPQDLIADACARLLRNLTRAEWKQYIGDALPYQAVCENLPLESEATSPPTATP